MLFFFFCFSITLVGIGSGMLYWKWPSKKDDNTQILSFIYSVRLAILTLVVCVFVSVIGVELCLGEWFIYKVKNLGLNLFLVSLYSFLLYICSGIYIFFIGYHVCVGFSFWRDFLWANRQELFLELILALFFTTLLGLLVFLQLKTHFVSLIEIFLVKNNKSTVDLLNIFLVDVSKKDDLFGITHTLYCNENEKFTPKIQLLTNGSEPVPDTPPIIAGEILVNPETGGTTVCTRMVDIMEANKDQVKDPYKVKTEDCPDSLRPAADVYNAGVDYSYGIIQALTDPNRIVCAGDPTIHPGNLPENSNLNSKPCDGILKRISDSLSKVWEELAKKGKLFTFFCILTPNLYYIFSTYQLFNNYSCVKFFSNKFKLPKSYA